MADPNEPRHILMLCVKQSDCIKTYPQSIRSFGVAMEGVVVRLDRNSPQNKRCPNYCGQKNVPVHAGCWNGGAADKKTWDRVRGFGTEATEVEPWSEEKTEKFYETVLGEAERIANRSASSGFEESRRKTFDEFKTFLKKVGNGLNVENAGGIDVVAFVHGEWMPAHRKNFRTTAGAGEEKVASASAIRGVIGHLAKSYSMMGKSDAENPAKSEAVQTYRDGYRNDLHNNKRGTGETGQGYEGE
jgi:hypothetical protein